MLTDSQLVDICAATYDNAAQFDQIFQGQTDDDVYAGLKRVDGYDVIAFRGSTTIEDWFRDFDAVPAPFLKLGIVEQGFSIGLIQFYTQIIPFIKNPVVITGHSLGAARAAILAGMMVIDERPIERLTIFGCPKPGYQELTIILAGTEIRSYRNRYDPVTDVPITFPGFPYCSVRGMFRLSVPPVAGDDWGILADHHIELYAQGVKEANL